MNKFGSKQWYKEGDPICCYDAHKEYQGITATVFKHTPGSLVYAKYDHKTPWGSIQWSFADTTELSRRFCPSWIKVGARVRHDPNAGHTAHRNKVGTIKIVPTKYTSTGEGTIIWEDNCYHYISMQYMLENIVPYSKEKCAICDDQRNKLRNN